jgi:hypothetical protein
MASAERKGPDFENLAPTVAINRWRFLRRDTAAEGMKRGFKTLGLGLGLLLAGALATPLVPAGCIGLLALNSAAAAGKFLSIVGAATGVIGAAAGAINDRKAYA